MVKKYFSTILKFSFAILTLVFLVYAASSSDVIIRDGELILNKLTLNDGSQGSGKILTSDFSGKASWQNIVPQGAVMYFNLQNCPSGWSELTSARGRYLVGLNIGGSLGSSVGNSLQNLENRPVGKHDHSINDPGHSHELGVDDNLQQGSEASHLWDFFDSNPQKGREPTSIDTTGITIKDEGNLDGTNAPYLQLLVCQKN
tara:strand:- start:5755 stop:6357 length:603 start_codon:yes stop_codon:yes gene_type:complete